MFGFPVPILYWLISYGIGILLIAMFVRVICSLFGINERFAIIRFLARITDPFIAPVRRVVRPMGVFDMSFFIAFFLLITLQVLLLQGLPAGW